jgi:hypothetical protein
VVGGGPLALERLQRAAQLATANRLAVALQPLAGDAKGLVAIARAPVSAVGSTGRPSKRSSSGI